MSTSNAPEGLMVGVMNYRGVAPDEFDAWYDTEHMPERVVVPGVRSARRYVDCTGGTLSLAVYELDSIDVLHSEPYLAVSGRNYSPWSRRIVAKCQSSIRYEVSVLARVAGHNAQPENAIMLDALSLRPDAPHDAERLCRDYVDRVGGSPGLVASVVGKVARGPHQYVAITTLASSGSLATPGWMDVVENAWQATTADSVSERVRHVFEPYRPGITDLTPFAVDAQ
jgi:hypothetical protein